MGQQPRSRRAREHQESRSRQDSRTMHVEIPRKQLMLVSLGSFNLLPISLLVGVNGDCAEALQKCSVSILVCCLLSMNRL